MVPIKRIISVTLCCAIVMLMIPYQAIIGMAGSSDNAGTTSITLQAKESGFINMYEIGKDRIANPTTNFIKDRGITQNNFYFSDLPYIPSFSYTIEAPAEGYYSITVYIFNYNKGYSGLVVDNSTYVESFNYNGGQWTTAEFNVKMSKGTHTVTATCALPGQGEQPSWCDLGKMVLKGGLTKAEVQVSPIDGLARLEAEISGDYNLYNSTDYDKASSGCKAAGGCKADNMQPYDTLTNYYDRTNTAAISYVVDAPKDGKYTVKPVYYLSELVSGAEQYFAILVNDATVYKVPFVDGEGNGLWNNKAVEVTLKAGRNIIRCIPYVNAVKPDGKNTAWHRQDYLAIDKQLKCVEPASEIMEVENADELVLYTKNNKTIGNADTKAMAQNHITKDNLTAANLDVIPHFSYQVKAPVSGYYNIDVKCEPNAGLMNDETGYLGLMTDNTASVQMFKKGEGVLNTHCNFTVYMSQGIHTLSFTCMLPESDANQDKCGVEFDSVTLYNGLARKDNIPKLTDYTRLEGETFGWTNKYGDPKQANSLYSGKYCVGNCDTTGMQTYSEIRETGLNLYKTPYVAYTVEAPEDGVYVVRCGYYVSKVAGNQYMALVINGNTVVKSFFDGAKEKPNFNDAAFNVSLKKGRNTIFCIPFVNVSDAWHNQDYLDIDNRLTGVNRSGAVELLPQNSQFVNLYQKNSQNIGNANTKSITEHGITIKNISPDTLQFVPYFAYTVDAPADGFYSMTVRCNMDSSVLNNNTGYIGLVTDDASVVQKYKAEGSKTYVSFSLYLTKGSHTLALTCTLPETDKSKACWTDFFSLTLYNGLKSADEQVAPHKAYNRLEAETYGMINRYGDVNQYYTGYSNNHCVGMCQTASMQSFDELQSSGLDKGVTPYVSYKVEAPAEGNYKIKLGYYLSDYSASANQFFAVIANGIVYKSAFEPDAVGSHWNNSVLEISLKAGVNIIYCIPYVDVNKAWHNQDYIDIDRRLTGIMPPKYTRLEAESCSESYKFNDLEKSESRYSGGWAVAQGEYSPTFIYTEEQQMKGLDPENPHICYIVNAPSKGKYSLRVGYVFGSDNTFPNRFVGYIYIYVNGKAYRVDSSSDEIEVEMNDGKNEVICGVYSKEEYEACGKSAWINFDYLDVSEGLTCEMPAYLEPESEDYSRYEAENYSLSNGYFSSKDSLLSNSKCLKVKTPLNAQKLEEIKTVGLDSSRTPYAQYVVETTENKNYKIRIGLKYSHTGTEYPGNGKFYVCVIVNGVCREQEFSVTDNRNHILTVYDTVPLNAGKNTIRIVGTTGDSVSADKNSLVWMNQDYLDVEKGISVGSVNRVEAEDSVYNYYSVGSRSTASGGKTVINASTKNVISSQMTFEKLNYRNSRTIPSVRYRIIAEEAGDYTLSFGIQTGVETSVKDLTYFAVIVNKNAPVKANYMGANPTTCAVNVYLEKGSNTVTVTCPLFESYQLVDEIQDKWLVNWIDHDYLDLPCGVKADNIVFPVGEGDELANLNDRLLNGRNLNSLPGTGEKLVYVFPFILALSVLSGATLYKAYRKKHNTGNEAAL